MSFMLGSDLRGKRLGIVGLGNIGARVARRARAFGMSIAYHGRSAAPAEIVAELDAERLDLDDLLTGADVVSLHFPLTDETRHLIGARELALMKSTATLINTARGPVVDERALARRCEGAAIAAAGLDVYENEPAVEPGLLRLENVVLSPHLGSATVETRAAMAELAARNAIAALRGEAPPRPSRLRPPGPGLAQLARRRRRRSGASAGCGRSPRGGRRGRGRRRCSRPRRSRPARGRSWRRRRAPPRSRRRPPRASRG